ncbi:MAG: acyl carrier protein [Rhodospirillales bacterium]|nr:acyl carrier protein [Bryobacteraceae bacterium]HOQ45896.1 acyl carrier protein [Bryobacteraceae bacterium]HPQ15625.1 acyl carrier protein [Bryobacteraceae bacterium]HPU73285.1 acyl carrier protein [Bryobacteraceae bacterium]
MREDLKQVFLDVLEVRSISDKDSVETITSWDSVRHLSLIMALEERFGVAFEADEIPELISVAAIREALNRRAPAG